MNNETNAGWVKYGNNPVLGGELGVCFDVSVLKDDDIYRMYFSWRTKKSIAVVESRDGVNWSEPVILIAPREETGWEENINRPAVVKKDDKYLMWYTGQVKTETGNGNSWIGYAESYDGLNWKRLDKPVLYFEEPWEKCAVMCPHVIWNEESKLFRMWYSGGEQYEPDAIGYATSADGKSWLKSADNPIFAADPSKKWEQMKVTACQVVKHNDWYIMFYIGFEDIHTARIGMARSRDGISGWERFKGNPIISPGDTWDADACYKPFAIYENNKWMLWYNGRKGRVEQIGLAYHEGEELGF